MQNFYWKMFFFSLFSPSVRNLSWVIFEINFLVWSFGWLGFLITREEAYQTEFKTLCLLQSADLFFLFRCEILFDKMVIFLLPTNTQGPQEQLFYRKQLNLLISQWESTKRNFWMPLTCTTDENTIYANRALINFNNDKHQGCDQYRGISQEGSSWLYFQTKRRKLNIR